MFQLYAKRSSQARKENVTRQLLLNRLGLGTELKIVHEFSILKGVKRFLHSFIVLWYIYRCVVIIYLASLSLDTRPEVLGYSVRIELITKITPRRTFNLYVVTALTKTGHLGMG